MNNSRDPKCSQNVNITIFALPFSYENASEQTAFTEGQGHNDFPGQKIYANTSLFQTWIQNLFTHASRSIH